MVSAELQVYPGGTSKICTSQLILIEWEKHLADMEMRHYVWVFLPLASIPGVWGTLWFWTLVFFLIMDNLSSYEILTQGYLQVQDPLI